jgi:uncharacterized damage-inducible protein DinB
MNDSERFAAEFEKALNGGAWHGPSFRELIEGLSRESAIRRPVAGAHSIAEILQHVTTWHGAVRERIAGGEPEVSDAQDWRAAPKTDAAWAEVVETFFESGRALGEAIRRFPPERIHEARPGVGESWFLLFVGALQHDLYHAGQIGLLKKASAVKA